MANERNEKHNELRIQAEQGDAAAQNYLGRFYQSGFGTSVDWNLAVYWYQRSAEQGYTAALHNLGFMYRHGRGIPQDYVIAATYFRRAIIQGCVETISHLKELAGKTDNFTIHYYLAMSEKNKKALQIQIKKDPQNFLNELTSTLPQNTIDNKTRFYCLKKLMVQETRPLLLRFFLNKSTKRDPDFGMEIADHQYSYLSQLKDTKETIRLLTKLLNTIPVTHSRYAEAQFMLSHLSFMNKKPDWKTHFNNCRKHDVERKLVDLESIPERIRKNVLNTYQNANRVERKEQRKTELKKIGENKYDIQSLFRLSLMSPKRRTQCEASIRALDPESTFLKPSFA